MPPFPPFEGMHPLVVHFPVALLTTAPLFVILALILPKHRPALAAAGLIVMALGTAAAFVAVRTGEAGEDAAEAVPAAQAVLHEHEELAERTRLVFTILTAVFAGIVLAGRRLPARGATLVHALFLVAYLAGWTVLANTAHHGGLLVHGYGVRAPVPSAEILLAPAPDAPRPSRHDREDDD